MDIHANIQAEQAVIGGLLLKPAKAVDICPMINGLDFTEQAHQIIYQAIADLFDKENNFDVMTVQALIAQRGKLEAVGGLKYLAELAENTPSAARAHIYAAEVLKLSKARQIEAEGREMISALYDEDTDLEDRLNNAVSIASNIGLENGNHQERTFEQINKDLMQLFEARHEQGGALTGISTGFKNLDERFNGLQKTDMIVLAGRPGSGKTQLGINILVKAAQQKPSIFFSMEMGAEQIAERMWSMGGYELNNIRRGIVDQMNMANLNAQVGKIKDLPIIIDDRPALTPQQVRAKCLIEKKRHGDLGLVVVDYIQLMDVNDKRVSATERTTQISKSMKALAKELECPVIALSQLNRECEKRPDKRPKLSDLRDSGAIEQDADIIWFMYRDDYYAEMEKRESEYPNIAEVITAKYRAGVCGVDYLKTEFHFSRFRDVSDNYQHIPHSGEAKTYEF